MKQLRNTSVLIFFITIVSSMILWNAVWSLHHYELQDSLPYKIASYYMLPTGMWQNFNVFAPPPTQEFYITITGITLDGNVHYTPPYQNSPGLFDERLRKWHEGIITDNFADYRVGYLRFWCREFERMYQTPVTQITMEHSKSSVPVRDERRIQSSVRTWTYEC